MKFTRKIRKQKQKQKGGEKKSLTRQKGQRNLFKPPPKLTFQNDVEVQEYNVNHNNPMRALKNRFKTQTRKVLSKTPHKNTAQLKQELSHLYAKISELSNSRENMYFKIQELFELMENEKSQKMKEYLMHKLKKNHFS